MTSLRSPLTLLVVLVMMSSLAGPAGSAQTRRPRATLRVAPRATSITFDKPDPMLGPKKQVKVKATVLDQNGQRMPDERVTWEEVQQAADSPLSFSRSLDDAESNTLVITAGAGDPAIHERIQTSIRASAGDFATRDLLVTYESTPKPQAAKITFGADKVDLDPDGEATITANLVDSDDQPVRSPVKWTLAKPELSKFVALGPVVNNDKTNSITVFGRVPKDKSKPPDAITLVAKTESGSALGLVTINYKPPPDRSGIRTSWSVLPPGVCGDLFGRTIKNDFYCVEVAIDNNSDSDIALGSLSFEPDPAVEFKKEEKDKKPGGSGKEDKPALGSELSEVAKRCNSAKDATDDDPALPECTRIPTSHYPVVQGVLARRKVTHPRAITMAVLDSMGSLLTGFNPFFHNINHAKNYSQFIDILSNPVAKGVGAVWQDSYPIEVANFASMILKDDKIIKKADPTFKTVVFVEKRNVFPPRDKGGKKAKASDDPIEVKARLGTLIVMGQDIVQSKSHNVAQ